MKDWCDDLLSEIERRHGTKVAAAINSIVDHGLVNEANTLIEALTAKNGTLTDIQLINLMESKKRFENAESWPCAPLMNEPYGGKNGCSNCILLRLLGYFNPDNCHKDNVLSKINRLLEDHAERILLGD